MRISERVIEEAVARYDRERDRYLKLAARVADICRASIVEENAIRAQVTFRTKTVRSFEGKLRRFAKQGKKNFATVEEVFAGIGDFAGVRIATYRPEDEGRVTDRLKELFAGEDGGEVGVEVKDKLNPDSGNFYRGKHCQVFLKDEDLVGNYENLRATGCEVQVCSMMAHVWNEIEHDIGYKPEGGGPGEAERGLLEALGHLTRSGDATITRLLAANATRLQERTGDFEDVHDFVARLRQYFPDADLSVNAGQAFDEARLLGLMSVGALQSALGAEALDQQVAQRRIAAYNAFLDQNGGGEHALNPVSADLITVSMLERFVDRINENHPAGRGKGRPSRIYYLAKNYHRFLDARDAAQRDAA